MTTTYLSNSNDNSPNASQPCYFLNEKSSINIITDTSSIKNRGNIVNKEKADVKNMGGILQFNMPQGSDKSQWISVCKPTGIASISPTNKLHFEDLPKDIHRVDLDQLETLLKEEFLIIFDTRPFNTFSVSRIKGAINMCVPTTLLKRSSFNIPQILNSISIPSDLKDLTLLKITTNNLDAPMKVLVYDTDSCDNHTSFLLYTTCMKFRQYNQNGSKVFDIYFLDNGFTSVSKLANFVENNSSTSSSSSPTVKQLSCLSGFQLPSCTPSNQKFLSNIKKNNLPKLSINTTNDPSNDLDNGSDCNDNLDSYHYNFRIPDISQHESEKLPGWLKFFAANRTSPNYNIEILKTINCNFNKIEKSEQARLKTAISNHCPDNHVPNICSPSALCPGCDNTYYKIPKGIEYGFKNRYNNIWPYEHSRVKLIKSPNPLKLDDYDDYFNANYINFSKISNLKYIATQNPLQATYEDFWKTIWSNSINVIICLNVQLPANMVGQERKYFDDQVFKRSGIKIINNEFIEQDFFNVRKLTLAKDDKTRPIYHLEYKDWPDFGVPSSFESVTKLIDYKKKIIEAENLNEQALVHCLAGCGRTGCFITLDMVLDCFNNIKSGNLDPWGDKDLVYKAVQYQRTQRISMVQNLDQFIFCYEFILNYVVRNLISSRNA
ncbi:unnamed protein product [Debaryomyces fabryi]|nr:unnamed protein product [Debaryomyces fabryi]